MWLAFPKRLHAGQQSEVSAELRWAHRFQTHFQILGLDCGGSQHTYSPAPQHAALMAGRRNLGADRPGHGMPINAVNATCAGSLAATSAVPHSPRSHVRCTYSWHAGARGARRPSAASHHAWKEAPTLGLQPPALDVSPRHREPESPQRSSRAPRRAHARARRLQACAARPSPGARLLGLQDGSGLRALVAHAAAAAGWRGVARWDCRPNFAPRL